MKTIAIPTCLHKYRCAKYYAGKIDGSVSNAPNIQPQCRKHDQLGIATGGCWQLDVENGKQINKKRINGAGTRTNRFSTYKKRLKHHMVG